MIADVILMVHALFVAFVVMGLVLTLVGGYLGWSWVRNFYFRLLHLLAIGFVVIQSWLGGICPLTRWEYMLRAKAGGEVYSGSFIAHWLHRLLYFDAPPWVFGLCYTLFGALVLASWWWIAPVRKPRGAVGKEGRDNESLR
jgi:hypothetical protein